MIDPTPFTTCNFCPNLCRHVCPTALASCRESTTPTAMMRSIWLHGHDRLDAATAASAAALCIQCDACTQICHHKRPVGDLLANAYATLTQNMDNAVSTSWPEDSPSANQWIAVETDNRPWAQALAQQLREPVTRWSCPDRLGANLRHAPDLFEKRAQELRTRLSGKTLVVADRETLATAQAAGLSVQTISQLVPDHPDGRATHNCLGNGPQDTNTGTHQQFCGSNPTLVHHHPDIAAELAKQAMQAHGNQPIWTADSLCRNHLIRLGYDAKDPVDWLIAQQTDGAAG